MIKLDTSTPRKIIRESRNFKEVKVIQIGIQCWKICPENRRIVLGIWENIFSIWKQ